MGGTSTDVSRYAGHYEQVLETQTAGVNIQAPQLDINTVAAGGGSKLFFQAGVFKVGMLTSLFYYPCVLCANFWVVPCSFLLCLLRGEERRESHNLRTISVLEVRFQDVKRPLQDTIAFSNLESMKR